MKKVLSALVLSAVLGLAAYPMVQAYSGYGYNNGAPCHSYNGYYEDNNSRNTMMYNNSNEQYGRHHMMNYNNNSNYTYCH